ncbi:MAG: anaerobic ribonucleoside-triphosphate reductase activating protein [Clostridia bacterium]|nr:anaerobic ribonucleoside-triphosphate reductase activating protein [Clostridia bacterium]
MVIKGLQKTTLLDFPGKLACTIFTAGCNFRCPFCHNSSLVVRPGEVDEIPVESFLSYISKRKGLLDGVAITGGEPLLNPDINELMRKIRAEGLLIKLDTNGAYPDRLEALIDEGLVDYVAMDIKNTKSKYALTAGLDESFDISLIERSIDIIMKKAPDYEFRTTVVRELHNVEDLVEISGWITDAKNYFLQKYVDSGDILLEGFSAYSDGEMLEILDLVRKKMPQTILRGV